MTETGRSIPHERIEAYHRRIEADGGRPMHVSFHFQYAAFTSRGASGRLYDTEFEVILDRDNGNHANHAIREVYSLAMERNLIPRLATRVGITPVYLGITDFRRGGFVRVPYTSSSNYDVRKDYPD